MRGNADQKNPEYGLVSRSAAHFVIIVTTAKLNLFHLLKLFSYTNSKDKLVYPYYSGTIENNKSDVCSNLREKIKKWAPKTKLPVRSRNKWKHCFLFLPPK